MRLSPTYEAIRLEVEALLHAWGRCHALARCRL